MHVIIIKALRSPAEKKAVAFSSKHATMGKEETQRARGGGGACTQLLPILSLQEFGLNFLKKKTRKERQ